jgi:hypothetical protein
MDITYIPMAIPMARGSRLPGRRARLVQPSGAIIAAVDHDGGSILRRRRMRRRVTASRISSTPIKARSLQASPGCSSATTFAISMDGKGAGGDNVFVEQLWRSVKYENVCHTASAQSLMGQSRRRKASIIIRGLCLSSFIQYQPNELAGLEMPHAFFDFGSR